MGLLTRRNARAKASEAAAASKDAPKQTAAVVAKEAAEVPGRLRRSHSSGVDINDKQFEWLRGILIREKSKHSGVDEATVQAAVEEAAQLQQRTRGKKHTLDDSCAEASTATGAEHVLDQVNLSSLSASVYAEDDDDDDDDCEGGKRRKKMAWTNTEDLTILAAVRRIGTQWPRIANHLPGRTADAVRNRWHRLQRIHALGDSEEGRSALDSLLVSSGIDPDWLPPESEPGSSRRDTEGSARGSSARDSAARSSEHARSTWTPEEDRLISEGVRRHGCKWRVIAAALPNRSDSSVRNRWMRLCREQYGERIPEGAWPLSDLPNMDSSHPNMAWPLSDAASSLADLEGSEVSGMGEMAELSTELSTESLAASLGVLGVDGLPLGRGSWKLADLDSLVDAVVGMLEEESCPSDSPILSPPPTGGDVKGDSACPSPRGSLLFPCPGCGAGVGMSCRAVACRPVP